MIHSRRALLQRSRPGYPFTATTTKLSHLIFTPSSSSPTQPLPNHRLFHHFPAVFQQQNDQQNDQDQQQQQEHNSPTTTTSTTIPSESNNNNHDHHQQQLTPIKIVEELDRFIVGQTGAKRAVAIAMRNRWRRHQITDDLLRSDIVPKNILMVGPTGCGKTEIARRLAKLSDAPFVKVEATKFTEVGYHGRDVDSIIRDLVEVAISQLRQKYVKVHREKASVMAREAIVDILCGRDASHVTKQQYRDMLLDGSLDEKMIDVMVPIGGDTGGGGASVGGGGGMGMMGDHHGGGVDLQSLLSMVSGGGGMGGAGGGGRPLKKRKMKIKDALPVMTNHEASKMLNMESIVMEAIKSVEQDGIVVIDEIDKICSSASARTHGRDASAEGVQRDLLPLIEGTTISTKYGNVNTDYILFIASGAFHSVKPSDMLAELQGRLPIRVELSGLSEEDLYRVLVEPQYNLLKQNVALLSTENVNLRFEEEAIREIAHVAAEINSTMENIGARRLHTVVEKILEQVSFEAPDLTNRGKEPIDFVVTKETVQKAIKPLMKKTDMQKFVL